MRVFDMDLDKVKGTPAANILSCAECLFGSRGWLSPDRIIFAGTGRLYHERIATTVTKAGDKFSRSRARTTGRRRAKARRRCWRG